MASKADIQQRLTMRRTSLQAAYDAYNALLSGQVQSYAIGSRNLTRLDLSELKEQINILEKEVDGLEAQLRGGSRRKAVAAVIRDW